MGKKFFIFIFAIILILSFSATCKKNNEKNINPDKPKITVVGDLHITHVTPKGQTSAPHETETIVVIFDQPMVALKAYSEQNANSFFEISPSHSGRFQWMGTKTLTFTPDERFPYSTEFKVTIPAGIISLNGYSLKNDYTWTFSTMRPELKRHYPRHKQKWLDLDTRIMLIFNQPVQKKNSSEFLNLTELTESNKENPLDFKISYPSKKLIEEENIKALKKEILIIEPKEKFNPECQYIVEIKKGFPAREGLLGKEKSDLFVFETYNKFIYAGVFEMKDRNPDDTFKLHFSNPVIYKELVKHIHFSPEIKIPEYYLNREYSRSTLYLSLPFEPETKYSVHIDPELTDKFGNKLNKKINIHFSTTSYEPYVTMSTRNGIIESYGNLLYPIFVMNTSRVFLQGALVQKQNIIPLLTSEKTFYSSKEMIKKNFFHIQKYLEFDAPRNKKYVYPLNLKQVLKEKSGLVFLQLDTKLKEKWSRFPKAFLQVTNLGITAKFSKYNNLVWVTELKTGLPVKDAEIEIRDDANKILFKAVTDKEGKAITPGWKELGIKSKHSWRKPRQWIIAKKGNDLAFTSSEWGTGIYPYRFGIQYDWNPEPLKYKGYIFSERGIYRAGEKVHIKGIIRKSEKGKWIIPDISSLTCEVSDPFGKNIFKENTELDDFGSFDFSVITDAEASLGYYKIKAILPPPSKKEKGKAFHSSFRVEAFRPAEFEVHLHTKKDQYTFGDKYEAQVRANYLYGSAMGQQKVSWHLRLNKSSFQPPGHKGYTFGSHYSLWEDEQIKESRLLHSGETTLDENGELLVETNLIPEKEKDSVSASLEVTVQGPSRHSISNRIHTLVHRGKYYIGVKPEETFLTSGDKLPVHIITTDPEGTIVGNKELELKFIKREWHSVKKAGFGGRYNWISEKKDIELKKLQIETKNTPLQVSFTPEKSGLYLIRCIGEDELGNEIITTSHFYVTGGDYVPWKREDDDFIELVPDKENYKPGDTARILVKSPYEHTKALLTIEREMIFDHKVLDMKGSAEHITIPILHDYVPNIFVSVILVKGRKSLASNKNERDAGKPSFKIGYVNLKIDPSSKRLDIDINKNKEKYKPGEEVKLDLKVKNWKGEGTRASVSLAVVDLGVLNLIGYKTPHPFNHFYSQKPLSVQTSETLQHILEQREHGEKGDDVSGGGGEKSMSPPPYLSEIELRGNFKFTAYWNPSILTDEKGKASISFTLPDNLTTFRIMAVAQTKTSLFGRTQTTFKVAKPVLLQPALPRFARLGDQFKAGVVIHNHTDKKEKVVLNCNAKGIVMTDQDSIREFDLSPEEGKEILYSFEVENEGEAIIAFRARMGEETDGIEITFPLKKPRPAETVALFDRTEKNKKEKIQIPENIYKSLSSIEFTGSCSALTGLKGSVDYLTSYPYLCLEQRLSSILPYLIAPDIIEDFKLSQLNKKEIQKYVRKNIKEIDDYQKQNGGFSLWPDSRYDSPFLSCYTMFALTKAKNLGYQVNNQIIEMGKEYLKKIIRGKLEKDKYPYNTRIWNTTQAFALYNLALLNQPEPSSAEKLFQNRDKLSLFGKTLLLKTLNQGKGSLQSQTTLLQELMNKIKVTPSKAHFEDDEGRQGGWIYSSNARTSAFILQSIIEIGSDHPLIPDMARWLIEKRKAGHWSTTQENFFVFYALNEFYSKYESIQPDFKIEVSLVNHLLLKDIFKQRTKSVRKQISLAEFTEGKTVPLKIKKKGDGTLYYGIRMNYTPKEKLKARDAGFAVFKEIRPLEGEPGQDTKAGSLAVVTLKIAVPRESLFVMVNDPLPAGFEAVNPTFITESTEKQRQVAQLYKDKRHRWWFGFNHIEMHDDKVLLFANYLTPGIHTHRYLARAITYGTFHTPGTHVEEMYSPEVFGRSSERTVEIKE
ncbi:MAG: Ig-like domain-containing protein [Candidatus Aminicenantaceae bacterium]